MAEKYHTREERRKQLNVNNNPKQKATHKSGGLTKKIFLSLIALGIVGMLAGVATFAYLVKDTPKLDPKLLKDPISSKILDKNGNLIAELGAQNRDYVEYKDIPKIVEDAFIATEDYRFYQHHGIDPIRLMGAVLANFQHGFGSEGASTITQQVVKNSFLSQQKTLKRKVEEAWLAYQLEQKYTKHQILEMYLNKIYFSENSNGVATAAKAYYNKSLNELTLPQAAMLAGLPQSPNTYNPNNDSKAAEQRRNIVLNNMYIHGYITKKQMQDAEKVPVTDGLVKTSNQTQPDQKPYDPFIDEVINEVKKSGDFDIFTDGLTVYTTVDPNAQKYVDQILNTNNVVKYPDAQFQAGITLLDTKTGEIRAIGGGRNQQVQRGFNYAIDTQRQPGSNIKPILDYGPAIEYLNWGTYQTIDDKPITYSSGVPFGNWDNRYLGQMTIRTALQLSRNTPAVQTLQKVGLERAKTFANNLGIPLSEIYESYAIGGLRTGVSPLQMAGAYSAFGNKGFYTKPYAVKKIVLRDGTELNTSPQTKVVMKDSTAFMITDMLKSVLASPGTGVAANVPGLPIAGKTGTTNYTDQELSQYHISTSKAVPDAWFTGYSTNYTISVWTGYKDRSTPIMPGDNQKIAQYIFKNLMSYVSKGVNTPDFTVPNSVQKVRMVKGSMPPIAASSGTPDSQVQIEYAVKGHVSTTVSTANNSSAINAPTNAAANYDQAANQITLTWNGNNSTSSNVQYEVNVSINGGASQKLATTTETGLKIDNPNPGSKYSFSITAISGGNSSTPITASIDIPGSVNNTQQGNTNSSQNNTGGNSSGTGGTGGTGTGGTGTGGTGTGGTGTGGTGTGGTGTGGTGTGGTGTGGTGTGGTGTGGTGTTGHTNK